MLPAAQCVCPKICCCLLLLPASAAASSFKSVQNAPKMDPQLSRNSAQLSCNSAELQTILFKRLSCTFRGLSCTPQLTATQSFPTFKKHYKTRATQRNSLQLTSLQKHRKSERELQRDGVLNLSLTGGRKAHFFGCAERLAVQCIAKRWIALPTSC